MSDTSFEPGENPDARDRVMAPIADLLLASAHLSAGERVLDVGCGAGGTTLVAARAVVSEGSVFGVDLSEPMLAVARRRLEVSDLTNVTLVLGDAQADELPAPVDVVISKFGTMFFEDPVAAFVNIGRALRPGGRLCFVTWQPLGANEWLTVPGAALLEHATFPDLEGGGPGMFAQSDAGVIEAVLRDAGYTNVAVESVSVPLPFGADADEATEHLGDTGVGRRILATVSDDRLPAALAAVRSALADRADAAGVRLGAAVWITSATR